MAKKETKTDDVYSLAEQLGIKKENLEFGLKKSPKEVTEAIMKAAKFKGLK